MDSNQDLQLGHGSSGDKTRSRKNMKKNLQNGSSAGGDGKDRNQQSPQPSSPPHPLISQSSLSASAGQEEGDKEEDQSKPQKRPKLVWTPALHQKFVDAVEALGGDTAFPTSIARKMGVEGITRLHISSHLQTYRLRKKELMPADSLHAGSGERSPIPTRIQEGGSPMSSVQLLKDIQGDRSFFQLLKDVEGGRSFVQSPSSPPLIPPRFSPTPCASAPSPYFVEYMKQELLAMDSRLEKEGHLLSPETRELLENEIRGFKQKYSYLFGSSFS